MAAVVRSGCYVECVDAVILTQVISMAVAVLAIVWHQQRSTERLRTELKGDIADLRSELKGDIADLRAEVARVAHRAGRDQSAAGPHRGLSGHWHARRGRSCGRWRRPCRYAGPAGCRRRHLTPRATTTA